MTGADSSIAGQAGHPTDVDARDPARDPGRAAALATARDSPADPLVRAGVVTGLVSSVVLPLLAWWAPGGGLAALAATFFAFTAAGPGLAALAVGRSRSLWAATAPATSLATVMLASLAQILLDAWSPPVTATVIGMIGAFASVEWLRRHPRTGSADPAGAVRSLRPDALTVVTLAVLAVALGMWVWATGRIELDDAGATGLIGVLPWQWFAALALIAGIFAVLLVPGLGRSGRVRHGLLFAAAASAAIIVTLTVNVADGGGVFGTGYVHVGFADAIDHRGALLRGFDARFSWPSFFTAVAAIGAWAGLPDTSAMVVYHPAVLMACYLPAIAVIGRALTGSARVGWLGALLFVFANWGQQDYFSPQSTALLLYLAVTAVVLHEMSLTWRDPAVAPAAGTTGGEGDVVKRGRIRRGAAAFAAMVRRTPAAPPGWTGRTVLAVEALLLLLAAALVTQHQLTPVALIIALGAWSLLGRTRHRGLWFGVGVVFAAWFAFGAYDWWTGHLGILLEGLGKPDQALASGLADRVRGDATYVAMQRFRIGWSAILAAGAFIGWLLLRGRFPLAAAAVPVIAPASLVLGQSYGGEMVLRVFLYASPFFAVLTAHALVRGLGRVAGRGLDDARRADGTTGASPDRPGTKVAAKAPGTARAKAREAVAVAAMAVVLAVAGAMGITARGVNVAFERTPSDVLAAARELLDIAPYRATVRPLALEGSLRVGRVGEIHHPPSRTDPDASEFTNLMRQAPGYVFLTSTREAYERIVNEAPEGYYADIARRLEASGRYRIVLRTDHVIVLERNASDGRALSENPGVGATEPRDRVEEPAAPEAPGDADPAAGAVAAAPETEGNR
ncbi:hypothetical protein ACFORJ_08300 [Corynebacterium hansenii]|uniref:Serine/threonine protein kinase n=1 Tax=Corynebacterium hansenii TaxID=394964 RepID=A0ABV7ZPH1_9CORY|nr:hypothetical protein [Corynebacterium hansenii]WJZ00751.1 hypothetical protein CHAN_10760 [Corynebacterium hansenii]